MLNEMQEKAIYSNSKNILVLAGAGSGKALINGTGVLTANGYKPIETISVGDKVFGSDGKLHSVIGVYPQGLKRVYEVAFNNNIKIRCNDEHLWLYQTASERREHKEYRVGTLRSIMDLPLTIKSGDRNRNNIYIPMAEAIEFETSNSKLPIEPYLLGYLLANASFVTKTGVRISISHDDIVTKIQKLCDSFGCCLKPVKGNKIDYWISGKVYRVNPLLIALRELDLMGKNAYYKFVPKIYLYASVPERLELLQGLFDGDGYNRGVNEYSTASNQLADDIVFLCECLGMTVTHSVRVPTFTYKGEKRIGHKSHRLVIKPSKQFEYIYTGKHHLDRHGNKQCYARHYIKSISDLGYEAEMTCIAVDSPDHSFITEHGIVTHNTHTMIQRISRLTSEDNISPESILVLTFTNNAAQEMKSRYNRIHGKDKKSPTFGTFHSFCYRLIIQDSKILQSLGYTQIPSIADDTVIRQIQTLAKEQLGIKLSDAKLHGKSPISKSEQFYVDIYNKQINKLLKQKNLITFDIMCYEICKLFSQNSHLVAFYKQRYRYIFIDEFQDTDHKQWDFAKSFTDSNLFLVGDCKQNLYTFRGSDSSIIKELATNPDWELIKLSENYRSTNEICEYSNKIHSRAWKDSAYNLAITSTVHGVPVVERSELDYKSHDILSVLSGAEPSESIAILCRTNYEVSDIKALCTQHGLRFITNHKNIDLYHQLKSAVDSEYMIEYLSGKLNVSDYSDWIKLSTIDSKYNDVNEFVMLYSNNPQVSGDIKEIANLKSIICNDDEPIISRISNLAAKCRFNIDYSVIPTSEASFKDYIYSIADSLDSDSGIYIGTIHSAKGLEYDHVHVLGLNSGKFTLDCEDNLNIFYVACTRAKKSLTVYNSVL